MTRSSGVQEIQKPLAVILRSAPINKGGRISVISRRQRGKRKRRFKFTIPINTLQDSRAMLARAAARRDATPARSKGTRRNVRNRGEAASLKTVESSNTSANFLVISTMTVIAMVVDVCRGRGRHHRRRRSVVVGVQSRSTSDFRVYGTRATA